MQRAHSCAVAAAMAAIDGIAAAHRQPFPMAWETHPESVIDLRRHLDAPAGRLGFLRERDGHIVRPDGRRFRFWGVNLCGSASFPQRDEAVALADRLARLGVNCIRLHGLDSPWGGLFPKDADQTRQLDPAALDRMDYLVAQLRQRGIYVNLNLNVARRFRPGDGVRDAEQLGYAKAYVNQGLRMGGGIGHGRGPLAHAGWPHTESDLPRVESASLVFDEQYPPP